FPLVTMTYVTSRPSLTIFATVPPAPNSESSVCAVTTITRSILSAIEPPRSFGCGSHCQVHRLASPSAAARTATFTDSPRGARRRASAGAARLALPGSQTRLAARVAEPPQPPLGSHCQVHRLASPPAAARTATTVWILVLRIPIPRASRDRL